MRAHQLAPVDCTPCPGETRERERRGREGESKRDGGMEVVREGGREGEGVGAKGIRRDVKTLRVRAHLINYS